VCSAGDDRQLSLELSRHRVADHSRRLGTVSPERLAEIYAEADVVLIPSLREGFGHVGLEAMAAGVPVVSSGQGGLAEYMRHEHNALLVPPRAPAALASAVARLLDEPGLSERLVAAGRETAPRYAVARCAEALQRLYGELR
jgi:glycosyltransferase involved in cell wall biosynthesis